MRSPILLSIALLACASAHATSEYVPAEKDACASLTRIGGLRALDNRTAVILSRTGEPAYLVKFGTPLPSLKFATRYAYIDHDRDGQLCGRSRDGVALPDEHVRIPTTILSMSRLGPDDLAALEEQYGVQLRPKSKRHDTGPVPQNAPERADNG